MPGGTYKAAHEVAHAGNESPFPQDGFHGSVDGH